MSVLLDVSRLNKLESIPDSRTFYTHLLGLAKGCLLVTTYEELHKELNASVFLIHKEIHRLIKIGVIESFFNARAYDRDDKRIFIGFADATVVDFLFMESKK